MTYAPRTFDLADYVIRDQLALRQCQSPTTKKAPNTSCNTSLKGFSGTVVISPPIISVYYRQAPNWGRELSFREAVLPLMYRVREDGLQTAHASATHSDAWHTGYSD